MFPILTSSKQPRIENSRHLVPRCGLGLRKHQIWRHIEGEGGAFARDRRKAGLLPKRRKFRGVRLARSWCHRARDVLGLARFRRIPCCIAWEQSDIVLMCRILQGRSHASQQPGGSFFSDVYGVALTHSTKCTHSDIRDLVNAWRRCLSTAWLHKEGWHVSFPS